jgi:hypothetical protein
MALREDIFPPGPPRDGTIIRTEWVGTWESQLLGLGRLTAFLSERLVKEQFAVDDIALNVIFLQRHRVEVGLKLMLERAGGSIPSTHKIRRLFDAAKTALVAQGFASEWDRFTKSQRSYVELVDEIDEGSATFRYPVDLKQNPWERNKYVDIRLFEAAGTAFQTALLEVVEDLARLEPVPIQAADAHAAAIELRELAGACRRMTAVTDHFMDDMRRQMTALAGRDVRSGGTVRAMSAYESVNQNTLDIAARADRMRIRIEASFSVELAPEPAELPMPVIPQISPSLNPRVPATQAAEVMRRLAAAMIQFLPPLSAAVETVEIRSATWTTPYARQLHDEIARLESRLFKFHLTAPESAP